MSTKLFKLTSGEEVVANIVSDHKDYYTIEDAVLIVYSQNTTGDMTTGFAPFCPFAESKMELYKATVSVTADVKKNLLEEYNRIFSKIQIAPASILK